MFIEQTLDKLKAMHLGAMAEAFLEQQQNTKIDKLSFDERFSMIVEAEYLTRDNRKLTRLLTEAKLRIKEACVEDIDYAAHRELDKNQILKLASCRFIEEHLHIIITGPTGVGKTYLACALTQKACRKGYRAIYKRVPRLLEELTLSHADGSYPKLLAKLARINVLILDDWGLAPLSETGRHDILEIIEDREGARSTIITSQVPVAKWHDQIGDPTIADAILDRIVHHAYNINLKGPSRRKERKAKH
jgi:DNA replication protein DnaC